MFVAMSRFVVANGMEESVRRAFADRPHLVDRAEGFIRMNVLRPVECPAEFWLLTYWASEADYKRWHRSHSYHDSHAGIPAGLKLVPDTTQIHFLEQIAE
jgi:heme-degrading monooxygenase HmoA